MFLCEYCEIFKNSFFDRTPMVVASGSNCLESYNESLDSYLFNLRNCLFRIFLHSFFWNHTSKKSNRPVFVNMNIVFLLPASANSLVDSFSFKYMSCLLSLIRLNRIWGSWYLIIWLEITVQSSELGFWTVFFQTDFKKWLFGILFLDSRFQNHPDSVILQKYQSN